MQCISFFGFLFSFLKRIGNTCAIHTQVNKQASVARIIFAGFFEIFSTSLNKIHLDAQINISNKQPFATPNTYDNSQDNKNTITSAPQLHTLRNNHPLFLVPQNYRKIALTEHFSTSHSYPQKPVTHIIAQQANIEDTFEQIIEQPHTTNLRSQNNHLFAHDEPPDWIPQPFPFIPIQSPTSLSKHITF